MSDLLETLRLAADDPMWADHAEVPKKLLRHTVDRIEALERENAALRDDDAKMQLLHRQEDQLIAAERKVAELEKERDNAREYGKEARIRENKAEDARIHEQMLRHAAEADKARLSEALAGLCDWIENEVGAELPFDARAALAGSGSGWREAVNTARKAVEELAHIQMQLPLSEWNRISNAILAALPAAPQQGGE